MAACRVTKTNITRPRPTPNSSDQGATQNVKE